MFRPPTAQARATRTCTPAPTCTTAVSARGVTPATVGVFLVLYIAALYNVAV